MSELIKSFITLDKDGGSGDGIVTASANSRNTGRNARQVNFTFSTIDATPSGTIIVQCGKGEATFPSKSGGTETEHLSNGYARITKLS